MARSTRMRRGWGPVVVVTVAFAAVAPAACAEDADDPEAVVPDASRIATGVDAAECGWAQAGHDVRRHHATACPSAPGADDIERVAEVWFFPTPAEVTGAPAVDDHHLYFGDWNGTVYAVSRADGAPVWTFETDHHPTVYAGQITASPALATVGDREALVVVGGRTAYALDRADGTLLWRHVLGDASDPRDTTEIEGAPAVADGRVVIGFDVHNDPDRRAGVVSLDLADGERQWYWDPEADLPSGGCGDVWGAPAVDVEAGTVVVGTANCPREESWGPYAEAIVSLDLATGVPQWSFQPHERGNDQDWDFAGAPNLFAIDGREVVGLGNKDGWYYVVDRGDGELVWKAEAQRQDSDDDGFAFGGFIGATAVSAGVVAGGTAIGDCPCVHGFDAATGAVAWQSAEPSGTYAAAAATGELVVVGGVDQTLRAFSLDDGEVVWSTELRAVTSSGAAIAGDELFVGVGFREPGTETPSAAAGVQAFRVLEPGEEPPSITTSTLPPSGASVDSFVPTEQACVGSPCPLPTTLKDPPPGTDPAVTLEVDPDPLRITVTASGLGPPEAWIREGSAAADDGASVYALFISSRDDQPQLGSILCTFTEDEPGCTATSVDRREDRYTRITLVAAEDAGTPPSLTDGYDRFVTTQSFDPPLVPTGG